MFVNVASFWTSIMNLVLASIKFLSLARKDKLLVADLAHSLELRALYS